MSDADAAETVRILIVDDNEIDRKLVEALLRKSEDPPMRVSRTASCYQEGLAALAEDDWDVAIIDHYMGDGTGLRLVRWATAEGEQRPMILLTGAAEDGIDEAVIRAGGQDFIPKEGLKRARLIRTIQYARYRQEANQLKNQLSAMNDAYHGLRHHLGVIGHELRTPLGAISLNAELNVRRHEGATRAAFESILAQARQLSDLAENLLEISRHQEGAPSGGWGSVDLAELVPATLELLAPLVADEHCSLRWESEGELAPLRGDRASVQRLLMNLVGNALKHTEAGSVTVQVRCTTTSGGRRWCRLEVVDEGGGIPPENLSRLGEPFAFSSNLGGAQYSRGAGLGLLLCRQIVTRYDGSFHVASKRGHGTSCVVQLRADLEGPHLAREPVPIIAVSSEPGEESGRFL